jgi:PleD family two-component response regulator
VAVERKTKGIVELWRSSVIEMIKRILIVDDESDICFVLKKVLSENGFVADSYQDPLLALEKFKLHSADACSKWFCFIRNI